MTTLYYQGHASYRLASDSGVVVYVDPNAGDGYELPADIILVTHQHHDHNKVELPARKADCRVITNKDALAGGRYNSFTERGVTIEAVKAKNLMHNPKKCVGYIITIDGVKIYAAGDTSKTEQMEGFAERQLDYALFPCDGFLNMSLKEAAQCAALVGAKHNIPIHIKPGKLFDRARAEKWDAPNRLILEPGQEITL